MVAGFARLGRAALPARGPDDRRPGAGGRPDAARGRRLARSAGRSAAVVDALVRPAAARQAAPSPPGARAAQAANSR